MLLISENVTNSKLDGLGCRPSLAPLKGILSPVLSWCTVAGILSLKSLSRLRRLP